ncbi:heparinase II/III domain-containing protein [Paenibacillus glucanolyticus]|uniref:heparinase II/III domain-containing protein n=1 Tax=Paenibacillus glucanolyticus TaxID=59843 RepID=UPI00128CDC48|nr:heparinase II/III family protein [Paenibacillus glucanolyticus]MPY17702.1 alginate lyase family protein [Paenibacillus glucanolyticus]
MKVAAKLGSYGWGERTVDILKAELDQVIERALDIPVDPGGWWHQYVCPRHHTELVFDPLEADGRTFLCPYGCEWEGEPYRGAWLVFKHQAMARYVLQAAAVYAATGERAYAELGKRLIVRYAEQFPLYPVHPEAQPWMLKGRAFHQALTEAIWATTLLRGYLLLRDEGVLLDGADQQKMDSFLQMLESSMTEYHHILTQERGDPENNYTAWLIAALFCIYAVRGESDKLKHLLEKEGGLRHHLTIAVRPDQLEFEGSIYYHVFVLRAYLIAAEMGDRMGEGLYSLRGEQGQSMQGMLTVLARLADQNGMLPALHDGPYRRVPYAREIAEIVEIGLSVYGDQGYRGLLSHVYREMSGDNGRIGMLEALLYGTGSWDGRIGTAAPGVKDVHDGRRGEGREVQGVWEAFEAPEASKASKALEEPYEPEAFEASEVPETSEASEAPETEETSEVSEASEGRGVATMDPTAGAVPSLVLPDSGFARLRTNDTSGIQALVDFGPHGGAHGHFDKLNLMLHVGHHPLSPDRGTVPYGSVLKKEWYPHTASHNTVTVGGRSQLPSQGKCMAYQAASDWSYIWVRADQAYDQGVLDRHLLLTEDWLLDWFEVELEEPQAIDWWFHYIGSGKVSGGADAVRDPGTTNFGSQDGYAYIKEHRRLLMSKNSPQLDLHIARASGPLAAVSFVPFEGTVCSQVESPGIADDPTRRMEGIRLHQTGSSARFIAVYRRGDKPVTLTWKPSGDGESLNLSDGTTTRNFGMTKSGLKERILDENLV